MMSYQTNKANLSKSNTWIYLLCAVLFLHFVLVRLPFFSFSLFYLFGIPLFLIALKRFLENPNRFFTKEATAFLLIFLVYSLYYAFINYIYNYSVPIWQRQVYKSVLIYIIIVSFTNNINQIKRIVKFSIFVLLISSLLGLLIFLYGGIFSDISALLIKGISEQELVETTQLSAKGGYSSGLSANRFYFPYHLSFALFPCIYFFFYARKIKKFLWLLVIIIFILSGFATGVMSLLVSWLLGAVYLIFRYSRGYLKPQNIIFATIIIVMITAVSFYFLPTNTIKRKIYDVKHGYHTSRFGLLQVGLNLFLDYPLGYGAGANDEIWMNYTNYYHKFVKEGNPENLHNIFLDVLVRGGIIGLFLIIAFFLSLISLISQRLKIPPEDRFFRNTLIASLIAVLANSLFHNNGFFIGEGTSFLCLALLCSRVFKKVKYYEAKYK